MRSILFITLFALFSVCAFGQLPRCNMLPEQLSGGFSQLIFSPTECVTLKDIGMIYLDFTSMWSRVDLSTLSDGQPGKISSWINYKTQIMYILDRISNECTTMPFTGPMGSPNLPNNAVYTGSGFFGTQEVDTYWVPGPSPYQNYGAEYTVTTGTCFPLSSTIMNITSGMPNIFVVESLWNVVPTVPEYIFDLPPACTSSKVKRSASLIMQTRFPLKFKRSASLMQTRFAPKLNLLFKN